MTSPSAFTAIGDEHFVSLTTFRKSGVAVSTPVWIAREGDDLLVTTPAMRNSPRVEMRPCDRMGKVREGAPVVAGNAVIESGDEVTARLNDIFLAKFRTEYKVFMFIERLGKQGRKDRVMLRITPA
jgi:PPOX class probable F420-dependent enzyme